jgi:hypothetical protein
MTEEKALDAVLLCVRKEDDLGWFADNLTGKCSKCAHEVVFRPHDETKDLPKVCTHCAKTSCPPEGQEITISGQALAEAVLRLTKPKGTA